MARSYESTNPVGALHGCEFFSWRTCHARGVVGEIIIKCVAKKTPSTEAYIR